jgi:LemA protein
VKTGTIAGLSVAGFALISIWVMNNGLVTADERVSQTYAQTQNQMQRQADLIPNLAATVKAAASFESKTLTDVIQARNTALRPVILANGKTCTPIADKTAPKDVPVCDPDTLAKDPAAQQAFSNAQQALANINVNALREAYPTLQSTPLFRDLMVQLEGAQNRITVARRDNQLAVQDYNQTIRKFPSSLIANMQGYARRPYFEASAGAQTAPEVKL